MPVLGQLAVLRARERRNAAVGVAIRAGCAGAIAWALTASLVATVLASVVIGLLAARRQAMPSLDDLADRIDRARGTHGLVRTALASEAGTANGSPLLVEHTVARADALLRAHGHTVVRPFRLPSSALAATALVWLFASTASPLAPLGSVERPPGFRVTGVERDLRSPASDGAADRAQHPRTGTGLGDFGLFVANGGRSTTGMEGAVGDVADGLAKPAPETGETRRPEDPDPCPPDVLCAPSGLRHDRASSSGGGTSGRAPNGEVGRRSDARGEPYKTGSEAIDQGPLVTGTEAARGLPSRAEGVSADASGGSGDGAPEKGSEVRQSPDQGPESDQGGGVNGTGGSDPGIDGQSERTDVALAEERVRGLWQASADGTVDAIEDGLAGERTSVQWRDLHAWYEAIAEEAVAKEGVPVMRRAYVQHYFDTIAPRSEDQ
jgi:hypothetical protein